MSPTLYSNIITTKKNGGYRPKQEETLTTHLPHFLLVKVTHHAWLSEKRMVLLLTMTVRVNVAWLVWKILLCIILVVCMYVYAVTAFLVWHDNY